MSGNQSPDAMTPDQLRELANSEISDGEREALEALRMVNESLLIQAKRITVSEFRHRFYPGLISENKDHSEYNYKKMSEWVGGEQNGFLIVDDLDLDRILFNVPSLMVSFKHEYITDVEEKYEYGFTHQYRRFMESQQARIPINRQRFTNSMVQNALNILDLTDSKGLYILAWYEIMDFFGPLPMEDERVYRNFRKLTEQNHGFYQYWAQDKSIRDYLGRTDDFYTKVEDPVESDVQQESQETETQHDDYESTDDWE
mgnify:FL=1